MKALVSKYYNDIKRITQSIDKSGTNDLAHEVILKMYDNQQRIEEIEEQGGLIGWIFKVAKNQHIDSIRLRKEFICADNLQLAQVKPIDYKKELSDILKENDLTHIETLWIEAYIESNANKSNFKRRFNISPSCIKKRIDEITNKLKPC